MLESLSDTLRGLQLIDQDPLKKALGLLQGSKITDVARSFSLTAGGTPQVVTTGDNNTTFSRDTTDTTANGTKDDKVTKDYIEKVIDNKLNNTKDLKTETTVAARSPSLPSLPDLIASPSGTSAFGQNPADLLTDQVNLTYQIFNLRMLLDRSLSDRIYDHKARLQAVLGFNVSLDPPRDAVDAAAVVEVTIEAMGGQPVSLVALMPQEKTYNSVALSTKSNAFGGSAVARMITVGYSERRRGQTFYLFRDNDTLSFERMNTGQGETTFGWQFRPVLGRRSVGPGMRQMFAVIALPAQDLPASPAKSADVPLKIRMRTYWRKYYSNTLTSANRSDIGPWPWIGRALSLGLAHPVPNGVFAVRHEDDRSIPVPVPTTSGYQNDLKPKVSSVRWMQADEKTAIVSITGDNFFSGTAVTIGSSLHSNPATGLIIKSNQEMDAITPIENIGAGDAFIIGRYGASQKIETAPSDGISVVPGQTSIGLPYGGRREIQIALRHPVNIFPTVAPVVLVNGKRLPGRPSVLQTTSEELAQSSGSANPKPKDTAIVLAYAPVDQFPKLEGSITVVFPFQGSNWSAFVPVYDTTSVFDIRRVKGGKGTLLLITKKDGGFDSKSVYGENAGNWSIQVGAALYKPGSAELKLINHNTMMLDVPDFTETKMLLNAPSTDKEQSYVYVLDIPEADPKPAPAIAAAAGTDLTVGQNDAAKLDFTGAKIADVTQVTIEGFPMLKSEYSADKKIRTVYLEPAVTAKAATLALQFRDAKNSLVGSVNVVVKPAPKPEKSVKADNRKAK